MKDYKMHTLAELQKNLGFNDEKMIKASGLAAKEFLQLKELNNDVSLQVYISLAKNMETTIDEILEYGFLKATYQVDLCIGGWGVTYEIKAISEDEAEMTVVDMFLEERKDLTYEDITNIEIKRL